MFSSFTVPTYAGPSSSHYQLQEYGFGAGGATNSASTHFSVNGVVGEVENGRPASAHYQSGSGFTYTMQSNVPSIPTLTNPSNSYYDRLKIVLNPSASDVSDVKYAVQISTTAGFSSGVLVINTDGTTSSTLTTSNFQSYTAWSGSSGFFVTGLSPNTTYYVRAKSVKGNFSESAWSPATSGVATVNPSLTFSLSSNAITFNNLNAGNAYTDTSKSTTLTTSTNAYNGYTVYAKELQSLTGPDSTTIPDYSSPNSTPTSWSGNGFGYTTSDTNLSGSGGANRFSTGSKYAGFLTTGSGDPVADNTTAVTNDAFTISYRVTTSSIQQPETYQNTVLYTIVPSY